MKRTLDAESHSALVELCDQIKDYKDWLVSPDKLQSLGIHSSQVALTDDGNLQFEPCFFRPYPIKVRPLVHEFDVRLRHRDSEDEIPDEAEHSLPTSSGPPNYDALLEEHRRTSSDGVDLRHVFFEYSEQIKAWSGRQCERYRQARVLFDAIDQYLEMGLHGVVEGRRILTARDLVHLEHWWLKSRKGDPPLFWRDMFSDNWGIREMHRYRDDGSPKPHTIISLVSGIYAAGLDQGISLHELWAVVNLMIIRTSQRPFREFKFHPILVITYMGPLHGRIIQASYDGERLHIQYSRVWSFEDEETAPVELFLRYHLSHPVGLDDSTLCQR